MAQVNVWIDQDLCTGDGICTEIAPDLFEMGDDSGDGDTWKSPYLAYVKDESGMKHGLDTVVVPEPMLDAAIESAEVCPGECIFLEVAE